MLCYLMLFLPTCSSHINKIFAPVLVARHVFLITSGCDGVMACGPMDLAGKVSGSKRSETIQKYSQILSDNLQFVFFFLRICKNLRQVKPSILCRGGRDLEPGPKSSSQKNKTEPCAAEKQGTASLKGRKNHSSNRRRLRAFNAQQTPNMVQQCSTWRAKPIQTNCPDLFMTTSNMDGPKAVGVDTYIHFESKPRLSQVTHVIGPF
jgi:hypothetical protein